MRFNHEIEEDSLLEAARLICLAARTAPKGKGRDNLVTVLATGREKAEIVERMLQIAQRDDVQFFARDAGNVADSPVLLLFGVGKDPLRIPRCGYCGFTDCDAMLDAGGHCAFNTGDLGIAIGSAVSRAADMRIDNRIMYSAGKAALELGFMGTEISVAYGLPLSATGKSPFFDRK